MHWRGRVGDAEKGMRITAEPEFPGFRVTVSERDKQLLKCGISKISCIMSVFGFSVITAGIPCSCLVCAAQTNR